MSGPKGFWVVLVKNRYQLLVIYLVINRLCFLHSSLELGMFFVLKTLLFQVVNRARKITEFSSN